MSNGQPAVEGDAVETGVGQTISVVLASQDTYQFEQVAGSPENQFQVRSFPKLSRHAAYTRVDTRLSWWLGKSFEASLVGQNLLTPRDAELHAAYEIRRTFVERTVFGRITWRF